MIKLEKHIVWMYPMTYKDVGVSGFVWVQESEFIEDEDVEMYTGS